MLKRKVDPAAPSLRPEPTWRPLDEIAEVEVSSEHEDYRLDLERVTALELTVVPSISGGDAVASVQEWRMG
jgi:hypothetical protein